MAHASAHAPEFGVVSARNYNVHLSVTLTASHRRPSTAHAVPCLAVRILEAAHPLLKPSHEFPEENGPHLDLTLCISQAFLPVFGAQSHVIHISR